MKTKEPNQHNSKSEKTKRIQPEKGNSCNCSIEEEKRKHTTKTGEQIPVMNPTSLQNTLTRIESILEWRFTNPSGELMLDTDLLAESIDYETLRIIHRCITYCIEAQTQSKQSN